MQENVKKPNIGTNKTMNKIFLEITDQYAKIVHENIKKEKKLLATKKRLLIVATLYILGML